MSRLFAKYWRQPAISWFQSKAYCMSQRLVIKSTSSCVPRSLLSMSHCSLTERITSWPKLRKKQQRKATRKTNVHRSPTPAHHMLSITPPVTRAWPASLPSVRETGESLKREEDLLLGQGQAFQLVPFLNKGRPYNLLFGCCELRGSALGWGAEAVQQPWCFKQLWLEEWAAGLVTQESPSGLPRRCSFP